jgi:hypothetical protein
LNNVPRQKLREIVAQYGRAVCENPSYCKGLLLDLCGEYKREVNILVTVLEEHVVDELLHISAGVPTELVLARLSERLYDNRGMEKEAARWGVESWALALGMSINEARTTPTGRPQTVEVITPSPAPPKVSPPPQVYADVSWEQEEPSPAFPVKPTVAAKPSPVSPPPLPREQEKATPQPASATSAAVQVAEPTSQLSYEKQKKRATLAAVWMVLLNIVLSIVISRLASHPPSGSVLALLLLGLPFLTNSLIALSARRLSKNDLENLGVLSGFVISVADWLTPFLILPNTSRDLGSILGIIFAMLLTWGLCYVPVAIIGKMKK